MRFFLTTAVFLFLISCREEENIWDKLSAAERAAIQARASAECLADSRTNFNNYTSKSNDQFETNASNKFYEYKNWDVIYKKADTETHRTNINVWKVNSTDVYFIMTLRNSEGVTSYKFLKVPSWLNEDMIEDLKTKKCQFDKNLVLTDSSNKATVKHTTTAVNSDTRYIDKTTTTYTHTYTSLAFFSAFNYSRSVQKINRSTSTNSGAADRYTATISSKANETHAYNSYTGYPAASTQYCFVKYTLGLPITFAYPYSDLSTSLECTSSAATGIDMDADGVKEFDPPTEL